MYDIRDVIEKAIQVAEMKKKIYGSFLEQTEDVRFVVTVKTLIRYSARDINGYKKILDNITDELAGEIEFGTYDKISSLVNQFKRQLMAPSIKDQAEFIKYALELEKGVYALWVDIQGRIVYDGNIQESIPYWVLGEMIEQKKGLINSLESFCHQLG